MPLAKIRARQKRRRLKRTTVIVTGHGQAAPSQRSGGGQIFIPTLAETNSARPRTRAAYLGQRRTVELPSPPRQRNFGKLSAKMDQEACPPYWKSSPMIFPTVAATTQRLLHQPQWAGSKAHTLRIKSQVKSLPKDSFAASYRPRLSGGTAAIWSRYLNPSFIGRGI